MQVIHVLRDDGATVERRRPTCDDLVRGIGLACCNPLATPRVPLPDEDRIPTEGSWCRKVLGAKLPPQSAAAAERRHTARRRYPSPGQNRDPCRARKPIS